MTSRRLFWSNDLIIDVEASNDWILTSNIYVVKYNTKSALLLSRFYGIPKSFKNMWTLETKLNGFLDMFCYIDGHTKLVDKCDPVKFNSIIGSLYKMKAFV